MSEFIDPEDTTLDNITKVIQNIDYNCLYCKHLHKNEYSCDAFPRVIPSLILRGHIVHNKPFDGDNGIMFEKAEE